MRIFSLFFVLGFPAPPFFTAPSFLGQFPFPYYIESRQSQTLRNLKIPLPDNRKKYFHHDKLFLPTQLFPDASVSLLLL